MLRREDLATDPLEQFSVWFEEAEECGLREPTAVVLATAGTDGQPSARIVLIKRFDRQGWVFYTNYASRKGEQLAENPRAALLFYWDPMARQVRIEGEVATVPAAESEAYFASRPRGSQVGAWASEQSQTVRSRSELEEAVHGIEQRFADRSVPRPEGWGGYRLVPERYEFWQHRADRLHDRFLYRPQGEGWKIERLAP